MGPVGKWGSVPAYSITAAIGWGPPNGRSIAPQSDMVHEGVPACSITAVK
jgi:hypothetical protein